MADPAPNVRDLAADALATVERDRVFAKDVLEGLRGAVSDFRDRGFLTELVYGTLRHCGTLDALLGAASRVPLADLHPAVRAALRMGLYQVLYLDRVPAHAAVDAAVSHAKARTNPRFAGFVNGVLRGLVRGIEGPATGTEDPLRDVPRPGAVPLRLRRPAFPDPAADLAGNLAARFAHPVWLVRRWLDRHPEPVVRAILVAGASLPPLALRARPGTRDEVLSELAAAGVSARTEASLPDAILVESGEALALGPVTAGRAAVQDPTAQRVAPLLDPRPGDRILDLCAAPGGKTLHLLDLLDAAGGRGEVVACDVSEAKLASLISAGNSGATPIARRGADLAPISTGNSGATPIARLAIVRVPERGPLPFAPATFHGVLVDAPCSNTGVLRRRVEVRDRLREGDIAILAAAQRDLLGRAAPLARPGGRLVYSTCSIEPEENGEVVNAFLADHPGWRAIPGFEVLPAVDHDGGFAAVLVAPPAA